MRLRVIACVLAAFVAGCSSINHETVFDGSGTQAFVLLAADGMVVNGSQSYSFVLQRMDLSQKIFLPEIFSVRFGGMGPVEGDEFKKPEKLKTTVRFGGEPITPGEYALISRADVTAAGPANNTEVRCFSEGAPVFRIRQGQINIIPAGNVQDSFSTTDRTLLQSQVATVLAGYPKFSAPVSFAEQVGSAIFETPGKSPLGADVCKGETVSAFITPME